MTRKSSFKTTSVGVKTVAMGKETELIFTATKGKKISKYLVVLMRKYWVALAGRLAGVIRPSVFTSRYLWKSGSCPSRGSRALFFLMITFQKDGSHPFSLRKIVSGSWEIYILKGERKNLQLQVL